MMEGRDAELRPRGIDAVRHNSSALAPRCPADSPRDSRRLLACVLAALLIVAGCSGGPGDDAGSGDTVDSVSSVQPTSPGGDLGLASPSAGPTSPIASAAASTLPTTSEAAPSMAPSPVPGLSSQAAEAGSDSVSAALQTLAGLPIKGRAPKTGYTRDQFGQPWSDDVDVEGGHNGCDTRNDILRRDITAPQIKPGTQGCVVLSGTLADAYSDQVIAFVRGETTSEAVQIDHMVALSNAWQTGAQQLTTAQRQDFANDPLNLQAVSGPVNDAKGDGDAATWLPPNVDYRCEYVARQIQVKARYGLWVVPAEHDVMARVLAGCGAAPATTRAPAAASTGAGTTAAATPAAQAPTAATPRNAYYPNCAAPARPVRPRSTGGNPDIASRWTATATGSPAKPER